MFIYSYIAIDFKNQLKHSTLIAKSKKHAFINITERNLIPIQIKLKTLFTLDKKTLIIEFIFFINYLYYHHQVLTSYNV
ncbi:hypothetical protein OOC_15844 [Providencia rettgeri Dmel1]|nr:hypothetical protein OOC_15844 [Providencia rettgeri Dmel1]